MVGRSDDPGARAGPPAPGLGAFGEAAQDFSVLAPHLMAQVTGSGFRGMLGGLSAEQVDRVRRRVVARLDGAALDATSLVGTGTRNG